MSESIKADIWAIVELFGHQRIDVPKLTAEDKTRGDLRRRCERIEEERRMRRELEDLWELL